MRKKICLLLSFALILTVGALLLPGCLKDRVSEHYQYVAPVYSLKSTVLAQINGDPAQTVSQAGQLYVKGSYIYLNDMNKGIHVIDNSDPSHPVQTAFLNIPGNENIGIRNNILYADMYGDLLAIDISDVHHAKILSVLWGFFTSRSYGVDSNYVVTSWAIRDTVIRPSAGMGMPVPVIGTPYYTFYGAPAAAAAAYFSSNTQASTGTGGSEAVMTLVGNYIYAIPEQHTLGVVDVSDPMHPKQVQTNAGGYDLETIFPIQDKLLVGSKEGVYVYSISNAAQPVQVGEFTHGTACDPVIANSTYAYVTLRSGTYCGGSANELDVLDAQDISNTTMVGSYPMTSPSGLCLDGGLLFVCDSTVVRVFDASNPAQLKALSTVSILSPEDVIAGNNLLLVVAADGLHEYDYSNPGDLRNLGSFLINTKKS